MTSQGQQQQQHQFGSPMSGPVQRKALESSKGNQTLPRCARKTETLPRMLGALLALCLLALCLGAPVRYLLSKDWPKIRNALFFPLAGKARFQHHAQRNRLLKKFNATQLQIQTGDNRTIHALWAQPTNNQTKQSNTHARQSPALIADQGQEHTLDTLSSISACHQAQSGNSGGDANKYDPPTALLFHANAMVLDDMVEWMEFYMHCGFSVLSVTFGGYPDPSEEPCTSLTANDDVFDDVSSPRYPNESSIYLDAEAALTYLRKVKQSPIDRILVHGLSIGGAAACALGSRHSGLRVTLDQTFTSMVDVATHVGAGLYEQIVLQHVPLWSHRYLRALSPCILWLASRILVRMSFINKTFPNFDNCCTLDGFDNVRKATRIQGNLFVIYSTHDEMMPISFARRLLVARYGNDGSDDLLNSRSLCVPGGHCSFFGHEPELVAIYQDYLKEQGLIHL